MLSGIYFVLGKEVGNGDCGLRIAECGLRIVDLVLGVSNLEFI